MRKSKGETNKVLKLIKKILFIDKPFYKKWWVWFILSGAFLFLIIGIPLIINKCYLTKTEDPFITVWEGKDVLSYYGMVLSSIIALIALIVTMQHNRKENKNTIAYNMAQINSPFFVIEHILFTNINNAAKEEFIRSEDGNWQKKFELNKNYIIKEYSGILEIQLKNIGEGFALYPTYVVDMMSEQGTEIKSIITSDATMNIKFDLQKNIRDKFVKHTIKKIKNNDKDVKVVFNTYVQVTYQNNYGATFQQTIIIQIHVSSTEPIDVIIQEISPKKIVSLPQI
jgi:hypothetical protein